MSGITLRSRVDASRWASGSTRAKPAASKATSSSLVNAAHDFDANTTGSPVLARPFFDTSTGKLNSELTGFPGLATGSVHVHSTTSLLGGEGNLLHNLCRSCESGCDSCCSPALRYRFDLLAGLRYMELREGLGIAEDTRWRQEPQFSPARTSVLLTSSIRKTAFMGDSLALNRSCAGSDCSSMET